MTANNQETTKPTDLQPPLEVYQRQFEALQDDARQLAEGLDRAQVNWAPAPDKWSIAQCLAHLNKVDRAYIRNLGRGIDEARDKGLVGSGRAFRPRKSRCRRRITIPPRPSKASWRPSVS